VPDFKKNKISRVLIIGYVWPEPDSSAAGSRMMQLIEFFLSQNWQITFASAATESEHRFTFESLGINKAEIKVNSACFDNFIHELNPDIVLFDRFIMEEQFGWRVTQHCPNAIQILETVDLHCLRDARYQALKQQRSYNKSDLFSETAQREIASILRCDLSLLISDHEIKILTEEFKVDSSLLLYLPFMLDNIKTAQQNTLPNYEQRQHFISIGNFRHQPNWDSVLYLNQTIWPLIHKKLPQAEMHIYGAYPPPKANQLHNPDKNFYILGWAKSAKEVMQNARICLAPLRFGAGLKGKLLDAMQYGTPSITTDIGAEGMHGNIDWNGAIENEPEKFAKAAIDVYSNKSQWQDAQKKGLEIINTVYDKAVYSEVFIDRILMLKINLQEHRLNNFTGAMLKHHSMKSTQYMAQWIEAKNKLST